MPRERPAARGTALVTGARRGIGRAVALALAGEGFDLVASDLEADDAGRTVATQATGVLPYAAGQVVYGDGGLALPRL